MLTKKDLISKYKNFAGRPRVPLSHFVDESLHQVPGIGESIVEPFMAGTIMPKIRELFEGRTGKLAVDIGCGYGNLTIMLLEKFPNVLGIDQCPNKIDWARSHWNGYDGLQFSCQDITTLGKQKPSADLVLTSTVLQHMNLEDTIDTLTSIRSMLSPKGFYVGSEGRLTNDDKPDAQSMRQSHMIAKPFSLWDDLGFKLIFKEGQLHVWVKKGGA